MNAWDYMEGIPMWAGKKHSLEEIEDFLKELKEPQKSFQVVHVAGTNGKGSVCAFLTSILKEAGYFTGTFISPHLERIEERFLLDGNVIGQEDFLQSFQTVYETAKKRQERGLGHPSYFEFLFYMAMVLFAGKGVEIAVLETGMGGRLDATNVIKNPLACAITSISLDHTKYLGDTIVQIAGEKAGIIKAGVPVVYDGTDREAAQVILRQARSLQAPAEMVTEADYVREEAVPAGKAGPDGTQEGFWIRECSGGPEGLRLYVPFSAPYQAQNAMIAVKTARLLNERGLRISPEQIVKGVAKARWPGRMEQAADGFYLDGAHNPGGIRAFEEAAFEIIGRRGKKPCLLFGVMEDKDYREMAALLCRRIPWQAIGLVHGNSARGASLSSLREAFEPVYGGPVYEFSSAEEAVENVKGMFGDSLVFCAGSLYLTGEWILALDKANADEGVKAHD